LDPQRSAALRIRFLSDIASGAITVVAVSEFHYPAAERLIVRYGDRNGLRTLDALHLAVALEVQLRAGVDAFVAADKIFCEVATLEGFVVLNPEQQP
jgi:predicted nucleic acid-binding protein